MAANGRLERATRTEAPVSEPVQGWRYVPLFHRVAGINAVLLIAAVVVTIIVLAPGKFSSFAVEEVVVLLVALVLVGLANLYLLRRVVSPLQALTALARRVDLANPGRRMPGATASSGGRACVDVQ